MARGRPRRKSLRNVSNCDVCERRGPGCPCVGVSAVTDPVQPIIGLYISTWRERMATLGQCTEREVESQSGEGGIRARAM